MTRRRSVRVSLGRLLRDGHWGALRPGISRQALVRRLGQPSRWERSMAELRALQAGTPIAGWVFSEVICYGVVEFHFPEEPTGRCIRIFIDDLNALHADPSSGSVLQVDSWGLQEGMAESAVCARLAAAGLSFTRTDFPPAPRQVRLVLTSGVRLGLTDDPSFFDSGAHGEGQRLFCVEQAAYSSPSAG